MQNFPYLHGIALMVMVLMLCLCRDAREESTQQITVNAGSGTQADDSSYLRVEGDSHGLSFHRIETAQDGTMRRATVLLQRTRPPATAQPLRFPTQFRLQEQSFQEESTSFHLTTGFLPGKRIFFHRMRCDHPGALHVKATMTPAAEVETKSMVQHEPYRSRMWLLPFEAEVVAETDSLVIEGEGEILLLWHFPAPGEEPAPSWKELVRPFVPDRGEHPDLSKIADALEEEARGAM